MSGKYEDILHLPHPVSSTHPRMSLTNRAAQFSPFAALTGHSAAIQEAARPTDKKVVLGKDSKSYLDMKLQVLAGMIERHPECRFTYFKPDAYKKGGSYTTATGCVKKIDTYKHTVVLMDGSSIPVTEIIEIDSDCFTAFF